MPKPCKITVQYDRELSQITGCRSEEPIVSEGLLFIMFLDFLFKTYPEIEQKYPPGSLALMLNGEAPKDNAILSNSDKIILAATYPNDIKPLGGKYGKY